METISTSRLGSSLFGSESRLLDIFVLSVTLSKKLNVSPNSESFRQSSISPCSGSCTISRQWNAGNRNMRSCSPRHWIWTSSWVRMVAVARNENIREQISIICAEFCYIVVLVHTMDIMRHRYMTQSMFSGTRDEHITEFISTGTRPGISSMTKLSLKSPPLESRRMVLRQKALKVARSTTLCHISK